jgi:hypothetical protein
MYNLITGKLNPGYVNEYSFPYVLLGTDNAILERHLRSTNEAADLNEQLRGTDLRWIPATR